GPPPHLLEDLGQGGDALRREVSAGALRVVSGEGAVLREGALSTRPLAGCRAVEGGVVDHHHVAVLCELDVELDDLRPELEGARERGEGVLGAVSGVAAMGDDEGSGHLPGYRVASAEALRVVS